MSVELRQKIAMALIPAVFMLGAVTVGIIATALGFIAAFAFSHWDERRRRNPSAG